MNYLLASGAGWLLCLATLTTAAEKPKPETEEEWSRKQVEVLRLAQSIDAAKPPVTEEMLRSGDLPMTALGKLAQGGSEPARLLLRQLLSYTATPGTQWQRAAYLQDEVRTEAAQPLLDLGDPSVLPTLRAWLKEVAEADGRTVYLSNTALELAIEGAQVARDETAAPHLERLLKNPIMDQLLLMKTLSALAELSLPRSKAILLEKLGDKEAESLVRCEIAAALVRLDAMEGRKYLLDAYDAYIANRRKFFSEGKDAQLVIRRLGDTKLTNALRSRAKAEPFLGEGDTIEFDVELMTISAMSVNQLKTVALRRGGEQLEQRMFAIRLLGDRCGPDLLPFLETLRTTDDYKESHRNEMRWKAAAEALRHARLRAAAADSR